MEDYEIPDTVTDKTLLAVFFAVFIGSGTTPFFEIFGYTHPGIGIAGAIVGAIIAVYEAHKVRNRIKESKQRALLGEGFAPRFSG